MYNHQNLIKNSTAFKIIKNEKTQGTLSHAYLIVCNDKKYLKEYMKTFAKLLLCDDVCDNCRNCKLIEEEKLLDVKFYGGGEKELKKDVIEEIIEDSFIKPYEADKKVYVICNAESLNTTAQNKFLKTLEEPPKNVYILLGALSEEPLLSTVKSRTKKFNLNGFSNDEIFEALKQDLLDSEKLKSAIKRGNGTVGKAEELYNSQSLVKDFVIDLVCNFKSSTQVLEYTKKAESLDVKELISVLQATFMDMLLGKNGAEFSIRNKSVYDSVKHTLSSYSDGALVCIIESLEESIKKEKFNVRGSVLINSILFDILEGKYKWQKL